MGTSGLYDRENERALIKVTSAGSPVSFNLPAR